VVIVAEEFKMSENLEAQLKKAIDDANRSPKKLELPEVKKYRHEIDKSLEYFEDFDKKALKPDDFDDMINLAHDILFNLANLRIENLKSAHPNEMNSTASKIDKYLPEWINNCTKITNKFEQFYQDLSNFIISNNIKDNLLFFKTQEEFLNEVDKVKKDIHKRSNKINFFNKSYEEKKIYSNFLIIIGLKSLYDLTAELEYARSRFKLLDPIFIKEISDFWKELTPELQLSEELVKNFQESELYTKEGCLYCIVENLSKIGCSVNNFFRNIVVKKIAKNYREQDM
ncbi:539_t:CDS:2, partial [Racocetra persica]